MAFLNITKQQNKDIVKKIDNTNYMKLGKPTSRLDLFCFAVAMGVREGGVDTNTPLQNKESFVRDEYIGNERFLFSSLFFDERDIKSNPSMIDNVIDDVQTFQMAEKFAETGFEVIKDYMHQLSEMQLCYQLLEEMDNKYQKILDEMPKEHIGIEFAEEPLNKVADDSKIY